MSNIWRDPYNVRWGFDGAIGCYVISVYRQQIRNVINIPKGATILSVRMQQQTPCFWALLDPSSPMELRTFVVYGTGHTVPDIPGKYIGAVFPKDAKFVFHVFEE